MGEKSGGLWLIVIVVVLAGILLVFLSPFYKDAIDVVWTPMMNELTEAGVRFGSSIGTGGLTPEAE